MRTNRCNNDSPKYWKNMNSHLNKTIPWPVDGLEAVEKCPVCGGIERTLLYEGLTDKIFFCAPGQWSLYRCSACESAFLDPRPTLDTISLAYKAYYTHEATDNVPTNRLAHIKLNLRNGYLNNRYHISLRPAWGLGRWIVPLLPYKKRLEEYVRHLPAHNKPGVVLDIGCGNGEFLNTARQIGWEAWGVDFDPKAIEAARKTGATVVQCGLPDTGLPSAKFDAVTLSHVIEHVHDPIAAFREAFRILKPGGQLWLATPNLDSFSHLRFRTDWIGLDSPRHLVLFTRHILEQALVNAGFEAIAYKPCPSVALWLYQRSFLISLGEDPFDDRESTVPVTLRIAAKLADYRAVIAPSRCENIVMIAKRPTS